MYRGLAFEACIACSTRSLVRGIEVLEPLHLAAQRALSACQAPCAPVQLQHGDLLLEVLKTNGKRAKNRLVFIDFG